MFGPISEINAKMKDLNPREVAYFVPLVVGRLLDRPVPQAHHDVLAQPVIKLVTQVNPEFYK